MLSRTDFPATPHRTAALDHIRALAILLVLSWHTIHSNLFGIPFGHVAPALALLEEGHVGVAVFICLSGYLFAQILDGKAVDYPRFILARVMRLAPLFIVAAVLRAGYEYATGGDMRLFGVNLLAGFILPVWPNGGWSIAAELQLYLALPFILTARAKVPWLIPAIVLTAIATRAAVALDGGAVRDMAYWTVFGRIDQFLLGILAFDLRGRLRLPSAVIAFAAILIGYGVFDSLGGFVGAPDAVWVILPTFEAMTFAVLIGFYVHNVTPKGRVSRAIAFVGFHSYGIYLLHFFVVFGLAKVLHFHASFGLAVLGACFLLLLTLPFAWAANRWIERPLQRFKPNYLSAEHLVHTPANFGPRGAVEG